MDVRDVLDEYPDNAVFSLQEFAERQHELELEAAWRSAGFCSYAKSHGLLEGFGQVHAGLEQAIFSCLTCAAACGKPVGVCEACTLKCHAEHVMIETGTRRLFRCDCATVKCVQACQCQPPGVPPMGLLENSTNLYGHNFEDRFCTCNSGYNRARDTMFQCQACDEWFHDVHIKGCLPSGLSGIGFEGMVCAPCIARLPFLRHFAEYTPGICAVADVPLSASTSPGSGLGGGPGAILQPWVCCLTCTDGSDDGRGVCMACAKTCHAGHVLDAPRITFFACDCVEMLSATGASCACRSASTAAAQEAEATTPAPEPTLKAGSKRAADDAVDSELSAVVKRTRLMHDSTVSGQDVSGIGGTPAANDLASSTPASSSPLQAVEPGWCATGARGERLNGSLAREFVPGATMFLDDITSLIDQLCTCRQCLQLYATNRILTWFISDDEGLLGENAHTSSGSKTFARALASSSCALHATGWMLDPAHAEAIVREAGKGGEGQGGVAHTVSLVLRGPDAVQGQGESGDAMGGASTAGGGAPNSNPPGFTSLFDQSVAVFSTLPAPVQVNMLHEYNTYSTAFMAFLREHQAANPGAVVTKEDVDGFTARFKDQQAAARENTARGVI